jgi:hypothetical protein
MKQLNLPRAPGGAAVALEGSLYNLIAAEIERGAKLDVAAPLNLSDGDNGRLLSVKLPPWALQWGVLQKDWAPADGNALQIKASDWQGNLASDAVVQYLHIVTPRAATSLGAIPYLLHTTVKDGDIIGFIPYSPKMLIDGDWFIGLGTGLPLTAAPTAVGQVLQCYATSPTPTAVSLKFDYPRAHS